MIYNVILLQVECVGTVDSGLQAMSWSPDNELLVLVTGVFNSVFVLDEANFYIFHKSPHA